MTRPRAGPLNWNVPIVNADRTPTKEFMQKWVLQAAINGTIPALSTPAQVSAVLDILGGTEGDLLRRGASEWGVIHTDDDPTKYLDGSGAYSTPAGTTYGVVTITADGLAPQLPNDATKYLDGTGAYSVPAGGGGGGGAITLLASGSITAGASSLDIDLNPYLSGYPVLWLELMNIIPSTNIVLAEVRLGKGSPPVYQTGGSDYKWGQGRFTSVNSGADGNTGNRAELAPVNGLGNQTYAGFSGTFKTDNWSNAASKTRWRWDADLYTDNDLVVRILGGFRLDQVAQATGFRFYFSAGNIASGDYRLLGIA